MLLALPKTLTNLSGAIVGQPTSSSQTISSVPPETPLVETAELHAPLESLPLRPAKGNMVRVPGEIVFPHVREELEYGLGWGFDQGLVFEDHGAGYSISHVSFDPLGRRGSVETIYGS